MKAKTILVVDDDADIREAMKVVLKREGYEVVTATNGQEALDVLRQIARPNLILLDLMMPVMDGWEFTLAMHMDPNLTGIPLLLVTAYAERAVGVETGDDGMITKPIDFERLILLVKKRCA
ncbi:MAG: response regulator [Deltaproteobacteria bacterium]|nr:response regulator [Deltaproteobacteria bacterium]